MKKILITSDDGYDSVGVKVLVKHLKDNYDVKIAGTTKQMSGVGGKLTFPSSTFELTEVLGCETIKVDGTPADAVRCAMSYWEESYDLVISGINMGINIGGAVLNSGTFVAAWEAMHAHITKKAIAISWDVDHEVSFHRHDGDERVEEECGVYPGKKAVEIIEMAIDEDMWGADFININLPVKPTDEWKFSKPTDDYNELFPMRISMDGKRGEFRYTGKNIEFDAGEAESDMGAVLNGFITITPCKADVLDERVWEKINRKV